MVVAGGILDWKLLGESEVRCSGLRYAIVRPCGLTDKDEEFQFQMEVKRSVGRSMKGSFRIFKKWPGTSGYMGGWIWWMGG